MYIMHIYKHWVTLKMHLPSFLFSIYYFFFHTNFIILLNHSFVGWLCLAFLSLYFYVKDTMRKSSALNVHNNNKSVVLRKTEMNSCCLLLLRMFCRLLISLNIKKKEKWTDFMSCNVPIPLLILLEILLSKYLQYFFAQNWSQTYVSGKA